MTKSLIPITMCDSSSEPRLLHLPPQASKVSIWARKITNFARKVISRVKNVIRPHLSVTLNFSLSLEARGLKFCIDTSVYCHKNYQLHFWIFVVKLRYKSFSSRLSWGGQGTSFSWQLTRKYICQKFQPSCFQTDREDRGNVMDMCNTKIHRIRKKFFSFAPGNQIICRSGIRYWIAPGIKKLSRLLVEGMHVSI